MNLFADQDVLQARMDGGVIPVDESEILLPSSFGFCGGVLKALKDLDAVVSKNNGKTIRLLGEIIHNETVNDYFREKGVNILTESDREEFFETASPDDVAVVPAFGLPKEFDQRVRSFVRSPELVVDTTCRYVRRIWEFAGKAAGDGATIIIHGKPNHPETRATVSRALNEKNAVILVRNTEQAQFLADCLIKQEIFLYPEELIIAPKRVNSMLLALVNQTTMLFSETQQIEDTLRQAVNVTGAQLRCCNTVCCATQKRQDAALALCGSGCDLSLVIGGFSSSNTMQLYRVAGRNAPSWFIKNADAFNARTIEHLNAGTGKLEKTEGWLSDQRPLRIAVLSGASCPYSDIGNVIRKLKKLLSAH